jgi:hypothetical protein
VRRRRPRARATTSAPPIAPLRGDPVFTEVRERVLARADAVAEAIWG